LLARIIFSLLLFLLIPFPIQAIIPGDLVINEIMKNPKMVSDANGEWFEIYNSTEETFDLKGIKIKDSGSDDFIITGDNPILISPGAYFVLGRNSDISLNGGYETDYIYSGFDLGNSDDEIIIWTDESETVLIDQINYDDGLTFPDPDGVSMALLNPDFDNSLGSNWTTSTTPYGNGDWGTPGEPNFAIPTVTSTPTPNPIPTSAPSSTPTPTLTPTSFPIPSPTIIPALTPTPSSPTSPTPTSIIPPLPKPPFIPYPSHWFVDFSKEIRDFITAMKQLRRFFSGRFFF